MLKLNYIICINLPNIQVDYLRENIQQCNKMSVEFIVKKEETVDINQLNQWAADEVLVISGDIVWLNYAKSLGMATLGYLPPQGGMLSGISYCAESMEEVDIPFLDRIYKRHHHLPWKILETDRCIIREFAMEDLDALFEVYQGKGMTEHMEPLYPYEQEKEYQQAYIENMYGFYGYGMWLVCDKETGKVIGRAGVEPREELEGKLELGYAIGVPNQGKGIATEVCQAILQYVREELEIFEIYCLIDPRNLVSRHLAEKLGFIDIGRCNMAEQEMEKYILKWER